MTSDSPSKLFALCIFGYRKEGMSEEDYHDYVSQRHAPCLRGLLVKNGIIDYTIVRFYQRSSQHDSENGSAPSFKHMADTVADDISKTATQYHRRQEDDGSDLPFGPQA